MGLAALFQAVAALVAPSAAPLDLPPLTAREKAALVVVSGLPAPRGVAGVLVHDYDRHAPRPAAALVFVDQEGGTASTLDGLPPGRAASSFRNARDAYRAGRATGRALRRAGCTSIWLPFSTSPAGRSARATFAGRRSESRLPAGSQRAGRAHASSTFRGSAPRASPPTPHRKCAPASALGSCAPSRTQCVPECRA